MAAIEEGELKVTYGTGAFLWMNAGANPPPAPGEGIIRTIAWQIDKPCYAYEGFVMYAGKILDWLAERLAIAGGGAAVAAEAEKAGTSAGALLIPAFQGLASPWWQSDLRAGLLGLSAATTRGHIAHAGLEAVCYQIRAVLDRMGRGSTAPLPIVKADGSMTRSRYFTQLAGERAGCAALRFGVRCHDAFRLSIDGGPWRRSLALAGRAAAAAARRAKGLSPAMWRPIRPPIADLVESGRLVDRGLWTLIRAHEDRSTISSSLAAASMVRRSPAMLPAAACSVGLAEMQDFAEGTSSRSSKLIHGGLRYLETYDFKLVRDALIEREILMRRTPHLVWPLRLVLPYVASQRPRWMIRLGLFFYDHPRHAAGCCDDRKRSIFIAIRRATR